MDKSPTSLRRIFGLVLLFLFFEVVVAVLSQVLLPDSNVFLTCILTTFLALAVWVVVTLVTRSASRAAAQPDAATPLPKPKNSVGERAFVTELKRVMVEANGRLAASRTDATGGAKTLLTNLPLFLMVGPPGSGKTSAIVNSGLEPQLLAGEAFRDSRIIPTSSCNFWFASGAIFADVSGHVFFDEADHWEGLLRLLSNRERKPLWRRIFSYRIAPSHLRGIVLVCDSKCLLSSSDDEQSSAARIIHERLQTAGSIFGVDFPVYTLFSNVDEVPYFADFFAHLGETEEHRILGATLPISDGQSHSREVYAEAANKKLTSYFNRLCASLASKRMTMLGRESFPERKSFIYEFPREMKRLRPDLVQFLVNVFRPNPLQGGPKLRGFYFSGIRQVPKEVFLHDVPGESSLTHMESEATYFFGSRGPAAAAALPSAAIRPASGVPITSGASTPVRWSFLTELFGRVLLPDHAAQRASGIDRRVELFRNIALGTAALLLLFLSLAWTLSWSKNRELIGGASSAIAGLNGAAAGPPSIESLQQLDAARIRLEELRSYEEGHPPLGQRWGLYSGERVFETLRSAYFAQFRKLFLEPLLSSYTEGFSQLRTSTAVAYTDVYSRLKTYRMIAACRCRPDKPLLDRTLPGMLPWSASLSQAPEAARLANLQIGFYTSELIRANPYDGQVAENENAVKQAQAYLQASKGPDRLLRGLLDKINREHEALSLVRYAPNYRDVLDGPDRIEWAYTKEGRDLVLKRIRERDFVASGEPCVIGMNAAAAGAANWLPMDNRTSDAVEELYVKEYIQSWKQFLAAHRVLPYRDPRDASSKLAILADGNRSPLLAMLFMVSSNTFVEAPPSETQSRKAGQEMAERAADRGLNRWFPSIQRGRNAARNIASAAPPPPPPQPHASIADIGRAFQPAWTVVDPKNPDRFAGATNAAYVAGLAELGDSLRDFARKLEPAPNPALWDEADKAEGKAVATARQLEGNFNRTPEEIDIEVKRLVEEPIQRVHAVLPENPGQMLGQTANAAAAKLCRDFDQLKKRYPFSPTAREDITIDELNRYFAPGSGALAQFVQQPSIAPLLQRQGKTWTQNPASSQVNLSQSFLSALSAQSQLAEMLYPDGAAQPHVDYTISLDTTAPIPFDIETGGHTVRSTASSSNASSKFSWPDAAGGEAKLTLRTALTVQAVGHGVWGIFRLLGKAQEHHGGLFVFNRLGFEGDSQLLQDAAGKPFTLRITVDGKPAAQLFEESYFSRLACVGKAVQ